MTEQNPETEDTTDLSTVPPERLAQMLKDKRKAEASLRQRLRDAEARADRAEQTMTGWQREAFTAQATEAGVAKTALADLDGHVDLAELVGDDGLLDAAKTKQALDGLRKDRPHLFTQQGGTGDGQFTGAQGHPEAEATWADVLK